MNYLIRNSLSLLDFRENFGLNWNDFLLIFGFSNFHSYQFVQGSAEMLGEFSTDTDLQQGDNLVHSKL